MIGKTRRRALNRIGNVVQLQIDKHLHARVDELADERQAAGINQLHAYLVKTCCPAQALNHCLGLARRRKIKRDYDPAAHGCACLAYGLSETARGMNRAAHYCNRQIRRRKPSNLPALLSAST